MLKNLFFSFFIISLVILSGCAQEVEEVIPDENHETRKVWIECMKEAGLEMYGSFQCRVCGRQRNLFGTSFEFVEEIECHPKGEDPQTQRCLENDISITPTWVIEKDGVVIDRLEGYQNLETLGEITGCPFIE